jgi:hypothetical protein
MHKFFKTTVRMANTRWAKIVLLAPLIGLLILVCSAPVGAQTFTPTAVLNSGQEPPPNTNDSQAFGVAFATFNANTGELCFSISYEEFILTAEETNAHFHAPAPPGVNAPVLVQLPPQGVRKTAV